MPLTEEMIVTGYRRTPRHMRKKVTQQQGKESRGICRKEKPSRTDNTSRKSEKAGRQRPERNRSFTNPQERRS